MKKTKTKQQRPRRTVVSPSASNQKAPFMEHLRELRRRFFYMALSVIVWSGAAYAVQQRIVSLLLKPSHGQDFVYTSPIGGIDFLFRVCLYSGLILSIPVIVYQTLK